MDTRKLRLLFSKFRNIIDEEITIIDDKGYIIDSTNSERIGDYDKILNIEKIQDEAIAIENKLYYAVYTDYGKSLFLSIEGNTTENRRLLQIIALFLSQNLNSLTKEDFIKGIILKEFEEDEIKELCARFNMRYDLKSQAIIIKVSEDIVDDVENIVINIHPEQFVIRLNNNTLVFITWIDDGIENVELGQSIYDTIFSELIYEPIIGVGTIAQNFSCLYESYQNADLVVRLSNIFVGHKKVYNYNDMLLPMLIDKLDISILDDLVMLSNCNIQDIIADNELLLTATKFLENNLNISDTARKLYIHRNTLIYRLNKIQNLTGLDLRCFKDAVNFDILTTAIKYLQKNS